MENQITVNSLWTNCPQPVHITVITPVFNRRHVIRRAIESVEKQTYRYIEYIIVDDGSTEPIDDIIESYLQTATLPVMYIKKANGGVHTARNMAYKYARGILVLNVDSDDELLPRGCEIFWNAWNKIPVEQRGAFWQIKAQCKRTNGELTGTIFPENINQMPLEQAWKHFSLSKGDQSGCRVTQIMKENPFPEPEGVTFVRENLHWLILERRYRSFGINEITDLIHCEGNDHLSRVVHKNLQTCRNALWNSMYELNNLSDFIFTYKHYLFVMLRYCIMAHLLRQDDLEFVKKYPLVGNKNKYYKWFLWFPSKIGAYIYRKTRLENK